MPMSFHSVDSVNSGDDLILKAEAAACFTNSIAGTYYYSIGKASSGHEVESGRKMTRSKIAEGSSHMRTNSILLSLVLTLSTSSIAIGQQPPRELYVASNPPKTTQSV